MREKNKTKLAQRDAHAKLWNAVHYRPLMGRPSSALRKASGVREEGRAVHIVKAEEKQGSSIPSADGQSVVRVGREQLEPRLIMQNLIVGNVAVVRLQ